MTENVPPVLEEKKDEMVQEADTSEYLWDIDGYFLDMETVVKEEYAIANKAREKGFDPMPQVEIPLATSMAEKCVGLISTVHEELPIAEITDRMLELEEEYGQLDTTVSFIIAQELSLIHI